MPVFEIECARHGEVVEIHFGGDPEPRGHPDYRGFTCEGEATCKEAGIECLLFRKRGFKPFEVKDAFEHFNS